MVRCFSMKLLPALMLAGFSGVASASGFQLLEQNVSGLGNAYAGSAAVADNASTIYFNPAGMTKLQAREVSGGLAAVGPSFHFKDKGSSAGSLAGSGDGGNAGGWAAIPNAYASWALNKDLYIGVGIGAPFGLKTEYDDRWVGAAQAQMFEVKTININPSIAYRVNEKVSLGFGLNWQKLEAHYDRLMAVSSATHAATKIKMTLGDDAWGWNVGALFDVSPSTKVGVSYRSSIKYDTEGKIKASGPNANLVKGVSSDAQADLELPDTFILSVTQKLSDKWEMLGDVSWTGWSSIPKVDIMRDSNTQLYVPGIAGQAKGDTAQTLHTDFKDTWRVALGANYKYNDAWKIKYGIAYDQTPVQHASERLVSLPDNDRVWFSVGTQWTPDKAQRFDFGLTYIHVRDSKIDNNQLSSNPNLNRGRVTGEYAGDIWILGAQYSLAF